MGIKELALFLIVAAAPFVVAASDTSTSAGPAGFGILIWILVLNHWNGKNKEKYGKEIGVDGWLLFLILYMIIPEIFIFLSIIVFLPNIIAYYGVIDFCFLFLDLIVASLMIFVGYSLWKINPKAVNWAKLVLALNILVAFIYFFYIKSVGPDSPSYLFAIMDLGISGFYTLIFLPYLFRSERIKNTYAFKAPRIPVPKSHVGLLAAMMILSSSIMFFVTMSQQANSPLPIGPIFNCGSPKSYINGVCCDQHPDYPDMCLADGNEFENKLVFASDNEILSKGETITVDNRYQYTLTKDFLLVTNTKSGNFIVPTTLIASEGNLTFLMHTVYYGANPYKTSLSEYFEFDIKSELGNNVNIEKITKNGIQITTASDTLDVYGTKRYIRITYYYKQGDLSFLKLVLVVSGDYVVDSRTFDRIITDFQPMFDSVKYIGN